EELWLGTDNQGLVSFDLRMNMTIEIYLATNSGLGSNRIQALIVETAGPYRGDVWAGTDFGISRYIRSRGVWIHMNNDEGLEGRLDTETLAIDTEQGRRAIYGGGPAGIVYSRVP
ncbi:MAG TPA: hypothetical protein VNM90_23245, partial [Haliangium sp.]|nr:hypothetical protein [Haliangium sp.]